MTTIRESFHYGNERRERFVTLESLTLESVADIIRAQATPSTGADYVNRAASDLVATGRGELGWTTWTVVEPAQPPAGYRWATEDEMSRPDAVVVKLTIDASGQPYMHDEADVAVPVESSTCRHCHRTIVLEAGAWIDPEADGDDRVWRETCDEHDTFEADHEPTVAPEMVKARDLEPGDRIDLEPVLRANPEGDEAQELADNVHWGIFELTTVERVDTYGGVTTIEHDNGVMISVSADTLIPRHS